MLVAIYTLPGSSEAIDGHDRIEVTATGLAVIAT